MMRYFVNIDVPEPFTSQRFKQLSVSDKVVSSSKASPSVALLNTACKTHSNGLRCANCEMLDEVNRNDYYMPLRPKSNDDYICKQVALRINASPINHLGTQKVCLTECQDLIALQHLCRRRYGYCGTNCNLCHNLSSTLAMLPLNLCTCVDDRIHWPRHNYEKDHEANVPGPRCGCGQEW